MQINETLTLDTEFKSIATLLKTVRGADCLDGVATQPKSYLVRSVSGGVVLVKDPDTVHPGVLLDGPAGQPYASAEMDSIFDMLLASETGTAEIFIMIS